MPGVTLPNISIVLPSLGGDSGTWDDEINAALMLIDAHDHTSGKGLRIKTAAIQIDNDLAFGNFFISALGKVSFTAITAPSSGSKALFVNSADNELYWRTNGGTNVKLTSGTSINTTLVGGIVGDYSSVGAEVAYDDANDRYTFKQQSTKPWAKIACGDVQIFETGTTESVSVRLKCPAALAASIDITLPLVLPGSDAILQMTTAGVVSASNTIANAVSMSSTLGVSGTLTSAAITASGLITANAGVTAGSNQNVTVSGTGEYKHGDRELTLSAQNWIITNQTAFADQTYTLTPIAFLPLKATDCLLSIPFEKGARIKSVTLSIKGDGAADITTFEILKTTAAGVNSSIGSTSSTNPGASWADLALDVTDTTLATGETLTAHVVVNATGINLGNLRIIYDRP